MRCPQPPSTEARSVMLSPNIMICGRLTLQLVLVDSLSVPNRLPLWVLSGRRMFTSVKLASSRKTDPVTAICDVDQGGPARLLKLPIVYAC